VAICHLGDHDNAAKACKEIRNLEGEAFSFECDVADAHEVEEMVANATAALGHPDIVVNCAGVGGDATFEDISVEEWDRMIGVHLRGTFLVTRACYPAMCERGWGRIINMASQLAYKGAPGLAHYCAAKAGIVGFTRALAYEGAPRGVLVNAIAPGPVETELLSSMSEEWRDMKRAQLPLGRFGLPEEIAPTALLLASDDGAFYVGQTLSPNGGDVMI
jgi:3-oxoacyl-[acyl-carrier protein] reductase